MLKKKAMSSERASEVKRKGHADAHEFAECLGIGRDYTSDPRAKKDVIDLQGNTYSVKSGEKKWQIFLYSKNRFKQDYNFQTMNGLGDIFVACIESFPESRAEYLRNKDIYKKKLENSMIKLCLKLNDIRLLKAFIDKSMFNSGEVNFLVIKEEKQFHVFWNKDVVEILSKNYKVENSKARGKNQFNNQKVIFKVSDQTHGEIEMRNDSDIHYREVKFWLGKRLTFNLLRGNINIKKEIPQRRIILYGDAIKKLKKIIW